MANRAHAGQGARSLPKPPWIKVRIGQGPGYARVARILRETRLHTVCEEALCPNKGQCWEHGRATILILGDACTRSCGFCHVSSKRPLPCDADEPTRVAEAVKATGLTDVVITSVTRDDLPDGGAAHWAETVRRVHEAVPGILVEVLIPDFGGAPESLQKVIEAKPDVLGHNLETVPSLYATARPEADYERSLSVLRLSAGKGMITKTALMVGLGESADEVMAVMRDARKAGCDIISIGQYLQPTSGHLPVVRYVDPAEFAEFRRQGMEMGFGVVVSAPLVRSSFHSDEQDAFVRKRTSP